MAPEIRQTIDAYLHQVEVMLGHLNQEARTEVLQNLEDHINEALQERAPGTPTLRDLEAVLAEMPAPSSYRLADSPYADPSPEPAHAFQLCRLTVWGAAWLPWGLLAVFMRCMQTAVPSGATPSLAPVQLLLDAVILILGVTSPFGSTVLGAMAIGKIRRSGKRLTGMSLAVLVTLFYPLLIGDVLLVVSAHAGIEQAWPEVSSRFGGIITLMFILAMLVIDYLIAFRVWKHATKPTTGDRLG